MKTNVPATPVPGKRRSRRTSTLALIVLLLAVLPGRAPTDEFGIPLAVSIELEGGQPKLQWPGILGQEFLIESRSSFSEEWGPAGVVNALGATASWTDPVPLNGNRFYRLGYQVPEIIAPVVITHLSQLNGLADLATASFASVRNRLQQMAAGGGVSFPVPIPGLDLFADLPLSGSGIHLDDLQRTMVVSGNATVRGQPVEVMFVGAWEDDTGPAKGFNLGIKYPDFQIGDWVSGLSGTALGDLDFDNSVLTLASAPLDLNLEGFGGNVAGFYGGPKLAVQPGLNIHRLIDLGATPKLAQPLGLLGFNNLNVLLEGFLGIDPNALFQPGGPLGALQLNLRAHLPVSQPPAFPRWLRPKERILEFTLDPAFRVQLLDLFEATPDGQVTTFLASTEIDTSGGQPTVTLLAGLAEPWASPFGIDWLTFEQATVSLTFSQTGPAVIALVGGFAAGNQNITTEIKLTETGQSNSASFVGTVDQITLGDVLELFGNVTGSEPFGSGLPDDALVLSDVQFSFDSGDERSVAVSATSTILGTIQTDVLLSFVEPKPNATALILGLRVHDFRLSALFEGINGTVAGDLEFPGVAFTIMQDLPNPPTEPIEIPSGELNPTVRDFYEPVLGTPPFVLEMKAGLNFSGAFAQSKLPPVVLDALGMDPNGKVLLEGGMNLRLGALTGGGLVALDSLNLKAVLPPPTRPRLGFPDWLANLQSGERILEFNYEAPDIQVRITDAFQVFLDGASRSFVTSTTLETDGQQQAEITLTGDLAGTWVQPFGVEWLTLDTVGLIITGDGTTASATLHSTFGLVGKQFALEMSISGNASSQLVNFRATVDLLSLSDFIELARQHLGSDVDPFGDSDFDFTFTNVRLGVEVGTRNSFSLGGDTVLNGKPTRCLFSALPRPGGGLPQIITGFQMRDWSLADALEQVQGTFVGDFEFDTAALVFSKGEGSTSSEDMDPETRSFYSGIFGGSGGGGGGEFTVPFRNGLGVIGAVPLEGNPLKSGLDALGASADSLLMTGSLPGSILGLGGGGGGLSGLSLLAALPPISLPDAPAWFISGQVGLEITAQPSVGFVGDITVLVEGRVLNFSVSAAIQRVGANVEFALTGGLAAQEPWVEPFGIEWLIFNNATVKVAVNALGSVSLGFAGDMVIGEKDMDVAVAVTISAAGVPTNFIFDGASAEGVSMADLVMLQQAMAQVDDPLAPTIPLDTLPDMAVRSLRLKFAPHSDPDLGVEAGFAVAGDLWIPSEANGLPDRNFVGINLSVDISGIIAQGHLRAFVLGPIVWDDAYCDLVLTLPDQHLAVSGAAQLGSFFQGDLVVGMTRTGMDFQTSSTIYNLFQAQLDATASFSLDDPHFTVHGLMQNDFNGSIVSSLTQKVKSRANASVSVADDLLRRGLSGWTSFRNNPHAVNFGTRITGFAGTAEWELGQWQPFVNAIQKAMNDIVAASPSTPSALLDKALNGFTTAGIPGVKTTILGQDFCNGIPYPGGPCWTVPPLTIGGVCHDPLLSAFDIPCSSTAFIEEKLIPPLAARIDNILENGNRDPMIVIEQAEFTADLAGLLSQPVVTLATRVRFMQAATRLNLTSTWDFSNLDGSLNAMRDALVNAL